MKSAKYCMFRWNIYWRYFSGPLLRCLCSKANLKVMAEMHDDFYNNHSGGMINGLADRVAGFLLANHHERFGEIFKRERNVIGFPFYITSRPTS